MLLCLLFLFFWKENIKLGGQGVGWVLAELEERKEYDQNILYEKLKRTFVRRVRFNLICFQPIQLFHRRHPSS